jgi:hypothetical protein
MLHFFDYVFYRVCKAYKIKKNSGPEGGAVGVVAGTQALNIVTCFMLLAFVKQDKSIVNKDISIVLTVFLMVFNYIKYIYRKNNNYKVMQERWGSEVNSYRNGVLVVFYIATSTILFIGLSIFLGSKNW